MKFEEEELNQLLESIKAFYGYDFSNYSKASLIRRIIRFASLKNITSLGELELKLTKNSFFFESFVEEITVNVTEMFRDPSFFKALRLKVLPVLATYPFIRIWVAGSSSGEEVLSLAIILKEEGLLEKSKIYATDINPKILSLAREGIYPLANMKDYTNNYLKSGGKVSFSDYYIAKYNRAIFDSSLKQNVVFSIHNLVIDKSFNEFNLILCRNVLIYFNKTLQDQVISLFDQSLCTFGFLTLGNKESLMFSKAEAHFETIDKEEKIYRKIL